MTTPTGRLLSNTKDNKHCNPIKVEGNVRVTYCSGALNI